MDRPLCGKGKSSLVGYLRPFTLLYKEGKKKSTTFPTILNNLAWIVLIVLKVKGLVRLIRSFLKNFPMKAKETARGNNRSLEFPLRFSQNKLTKWHAFVTNNECTHPHMVLRKGASRHTPRHIPTSHRQSSWASPGQWIDWFKGKPSNLPRGENNILRKTKATSHSTHLTIFLDPHGVHRTRHILYRAHHREFLPFPNKRACFGHRHNRDSSDGWKKQKWGPQITCSTILGHFHLPHFRKCIHLTGWSFK